jgi:hypothetical protein
MDERTASQRADGGVSGVPDTWPLSAALGVSERTVRRAIARGELPAAKRDGVYRIGPADLTPDQARPWFGNYLKRRLRTGPGESRNALMRVRAGRRTLWTSGRFGLRRRSAAQRTRSP